MTWIKTVSSGARVISRSAPRGGVSLRPCRSWRRCVHVHEAGSASSSRGLKWSQTAKSTMAGVFDIDLDQPEENVSDDELEEVKDARCSEGNGTRECSVQAWGPRSERRAALCYANRLTRLPYSVFYALNSWYSACQHMCQIYLRVTCWNMFYMQQSKIRAGDNRVICELTTWQYSNVTVQAI